LKKAREQSCAAGREGGNNKGGLRSGLAKKYETQVGETQREMWRKRERKRSNLYQLLLDPVHF